MADQPTYRVVHKALHRPLDGVRRGPAPVLPGAADGSGGLQPLLLVPRRAADLLRALRICLVGDGARPADAPDHAGILASAPPVRPRQA